MLALVATTMFLSAALLFAVEPMFARMVLPRLGGSPAVWNTAMVFYQAALLAGYGYAHAMRGGNRRWRLAHLALMGAAVLLLPLRLAAGNAPAPGANPIPWLLAMMTVTVGAPFVLIATTGPLIQRWFGESGHPRARDPYFLYGASNLGSLLGLLAYPFLIEPRWTLSQQSRLWMSGYVLLIVLVAACAWLARRAQEAPERSEADTVDDAPPPTALRRLRWVALAFVPSSLMLGVTTHLSMDIVAMPLLWVIPLAVYLVTFIVAFAPGMRLPLPLLTRILAVLAIGTVIVMVGHATEPLAFMIGLHLATLLVAGLLAHGMLAADRPGVRHLTEFYLWLALGGVLGGVFNALVAPLVFHSVAEYPIALVAACALAPASRGPVRATWRDAVVGIGCAVCLAAVLLGVRALGHAWTRPDLVLFIAALCIPIYAFRTRPARLGMAAASLIFVPTMVLGPNDGTLIAVRSFFGIHRVQTVPGPAGEMHRLVHGTTVHGLEWTDPTRRSEPLGYYHRFGPAGEVFDSLGARLTTIGVAGLGSGGLIAYARPGQRWTYFEIDPVVAQIASDTTYFSFIAGSRAPVRLQLGDARLSIAADTTRYDMLVLDAYSSDAIPVHLLTREAFGLYLDRLAPHGVLVLHLSNRYFDLEPVVARLSADTGLRCHVRQDSTTSDAERAVGRIGSCWALVSRDDSDIGPLATDVRWRPPHHPPGSPLWTDDFSSLVSVLR